MLYNKSGINLTIHFDEKHFLLDHHRVHGLRLLPGAAHLDIACKFVREIYPFENFNCIEDVSWINPIICERGSIDVNLKITKMSGKVEFCFDDYGGKIYSRGYVCRNKEWVRSSLDPSYEDFFFDNIVQKDFLYKEFIRLGITYGSFFQCLNDVKIKDNVGMGNISSKSQELGFVNLLDCSFQSGMAISLSNNFPNLMPISLGALEIKDNLKISQRMHYFAKTKKINQFRTNIIIADDKNNIVMKIKDLGIRPGVF